VNQPPTAAAAICTPIPPNPTARLKLVEGTALSRNRRLGSADAPEPCSGTRSAASARAHASMAPSIRTGVRRRVTPAGSLASSAYGVPIAALWLPCYFKDTTLSAGNRKALDGVSLIWDYALLRLCSCVRSSAPVAEYAIVPELWLRLGVFTPLIGEAMIGALPTMSATCFFSCACLLAPCLLCAKWVPDQSNATSYGMSSTSYEMIAIEMHNFLLHSLRTMHLSILIHTKLAKYLTRPY